MLAPGEYLINPVPYAPAPTPVAVRTVEQQPTPLAGRDTEHAAVATPTQPPDDEKPSFLLILLRALGAIHC